MTDIRIEFKNAKQFQKALLNTESIIYRKTQQALNRTLVRSRTKMTNVIGEKLNLKKKTIRELIAIQKANKNTGLIGRLIVKNKPVALIEYNAKQNRKGVSFKMFRDRPRQMIRQAFITPDSRNKITVFKREGKARLRIKPLYGTRLSDTAIDKQIEIIKFIKIIFRNEINNTLAKTGVSKVILTFLLISFSWPFNFIDYGINT